MTLLNLSGLNFVPYCESPPWKHNSKCIPTLRRVKLPWKTPVTAGGDHQAFHHFIGGLTSCGNIKLSSLTSMSSVTFNFRGLKSSDSQAKLFQLNHRVVTRPQRKIVFFYQVFCIFQVKQINLRRTREQCHGIWKLKYCNSTRFPVKLCNMISGPKETFDLGKQASCSGFMCAVWWSISFLFLSHSPGFHTNQPSGVFTYPSYPQQNRGTCVYHLWAFSQWLGCQRLVVDSRTSLSHRFFHPPNI